MSIFRRKDEDPHGPEAQATEPEAEPELAPSSPEPEAPAPPAVPPPRPRNESIVPRPLASHDQRPGGRIVTPRDGETVGGVVDVEVEAPKLDGGVERIEIEYSVDRSRWRDVGAVT